MMAEVRFRLTMLTPLHVGTGEGIEPFEYVIDGDVLHRFTLGSLMPALPREEQARFVDVVEGPLPGIRRFVADHAATAAQVAHWSAGVSPAAGDLYDRLIGGSQSQPEVMACIREGKDQRPYVPGSSLKGALRTALLYDAMEKEHPGRDARRLEQQVFRFKWVQQDPFRAFKVGDGLPLGGRNVVHAVGVCTRQNGRWRPPSIEMLVETVPGALADGTETVSEHAVTFDEEFYRYHQNAFPLNAGAVLAACRAFYGTHLATERQFTRDHPGAAAAYEALAAHAEALPEHACLVRLAWGSGRDATTVAYALRDSERPRSRRLTAEGFPLGWAELAIFDAGGQPLQVEAGQTVPAAGPTPAAERRDTRPRRMADLQAGMVLEGTVRRTAQYGAFVDVGVERDGLVHISKLSDGFVHMVEEVVVQGDRVRVEVLDVDLRRRRISLRLVEVL